MTTPDAARACHAQREPWRGPWPTARTRTPTARRQITRHEDETGPVGDQSRSLSPLTLKLTAEVSAGLQVFGSSLARMLTSARQGPSVDEYRLSTR
jgi:hypothetical protein